MRLEEVERRQIVDHARNEERFKLILDAMQDKTFPPQKEFFDGQIYDAFGSRGEEHAQEPSSCRRCGTIQRAIRQYAHGQGIDQVP